MPTLITCPGCTHKLTLPEDVVDCDQWLAELTRSALAGPIPILLGGHSLVGPGIRLVAAG